MIDMRNYTEIPDIGNRNLHNNTNNNHKQLELYHFPEAISQQKKKKKKLRTFKRRSRPTWAATSRSETAVPEAAAWQEIEKLLEEE